MTEEKATISRKTQNVPIKEIRMLAKRKVRKVPRLRLQSTKMTRSPLSVSETE